MVLWWWWIIGGSRESTCCGPQIAKAFGGDVTGVCSTSKVDLVHSLGANHVIDYLHTNVVDGPRRYDAILDIGGNTRLADLRHILNPRGTLVIVGGETDGRWLGGTSRQLKAALLSPLSRQKLCAFIAPENSHDLTVLGELIDAGRVHSAIDRTFLLAEAPKAIQYVREGHAQGKVVITT